MIKMILAVDTEGGIGKDGRLPWHIPSEMRYFKYYTKGCTCVMGRKTYEDIKAFKKTDSGSFLSYRSVIVITNDVRGLEANNTYDNIFFNENPEQLMEMMRLTQISDNPDVQDFCIVGGKKIYDMFSHSGIVEEISITFLDKSYDCDTFVDVDKLTEDYELFCTHLGPDMWNVNIYRRKDEKW